MTIATGDQRWLIALDIDGTLVRPEVMAGTGFLGEHSDEIYYLPADDLYLTGTSEVALAGYHRDEIIDLSNGPLRYAGWSTCYRREAGSAGRDTRGILRVHQFNKLEMFSYVKPEDAEQEHLKLLALEEEMLQACELSYRVIDTAAGDLGSSAARKYDSEAWMPSQNQHRELTSSSNCTTFQARRLNVRYRTEANGPSPLPWRRRGHRAQMTIATGDQRWLIALDIDGTLVHDNGFLSPRVVEQVARVRALGHEVIVATGRSAANAIPVIKDVGIHHGYAVCSNGAVTIKVEPEHERGFTPHEVITFNPAEVLSKLIVKLPNAHFAVENADGTYKFHRPFPSHALGEHNFETPLEELMSEPVSRVVVLSPDHDAEEFVGVIAEIGLHSVSYAIGYTAWLDISPQGISKASALETRRKELGILRSQVITVGDGRNDIDMFAWAIAGGGYGFAMGQGPEEVHAAASAVVASVEDDGVAEVLAGFEGILFSRSFG